MKKGFIHLLVIVFLLLPAISQAKTKAPNHVLFGIYPISLSDIDTSNGSFNLSFYAWWVTKDKNFKPLDSIEIVNSREYYYKSAGVTKIGDDYSTFARYYAKLIHPWNSKNFPFGRQFLEVKVEDFQDTNSIIFVPDFSQSKLHPELTIPGWKIIGFTIKQSVINYATNFGDLTSPGSLYSRLTFIIEIKRNGWKLYATYFIGFFMAGVLVHIIYLMNNFAFPGRATIFVGSVFSFVGNKYTIDQKIPLSSEFTLADGIEVATFIAMMASIITCIITEKLGNDIKTRTRVSHITGGISAVIYTIYISWRTYLAVIS